ncbi:MAG TPA: PDZ domain-containing protein [Usitatibacter sp.]|nr:PDZ domain-containing protein [Usitatibacter sp.]
MKAFAAAAAAGLALAAGAADLPRGGFLGVQLGPVPNGTGALVQALLPGGSAASVGLAKDDVVVGVNGAPVATPADLVAGVGRLHAGDRIALRYIRAGTGLEGSGTVVPRPYESAVDIDTAYEAIEVRGALRRTLVTMPRADGRHPAVLYLTGIGCFSQEDASLQSTESKLLYGLSRAGFVTMRVEKTGIGDSQGPSCASDAADFNLEVAGYMAGLKALRERANVDPDRVFVLGLSIGGIEAPLVAQEGGVRGVVVVNTLARPFVEYVLETFRRQGRLGKVPFDELDRRMRRDERCIHEALIEGRTDVVEKSPECAEPLGFPARLSFMRQWAAVDPAAEWKKVAAPVLIVHGGKDFVATGDTDAPLLRDIVEAFHPGNATLALIPTMDHYLGHVATMEDSLAKTSGPFGAFEPALLDLVRDWLERHAG